MQRAIPALVFLAIALALGTAYPARGQPAPAPGVLRVAFAQAETGFDPQALADSTSSTVADAIFEPLYRNAQVAGSWQAVPNTAAGMPEISADGRTWTIRLRPGIHITDDPAFKGRPRELVAADYVYSIKRLLDPRMRAPAIGAVDGLLEGADEVVARAKATGRFDYDATIPGLVAPDRYTLQFRLNFPTTVLLTDLAGGPSAAVAREVVEAYGDADGRIMERPVGTGPFRLAEWQRGRRIVLERNAAHREARQGGLRRVEATVIEEGQTRLLAFQRGDLDYVHVPPGLIGSVVDAGGKLSPALAREGVAMHRAVQPSINYTYFNMEDPVVGGAAPERIALRRAVAMAYDVDREVRVLLQGQGIVATQLIPPGTGGHDPALRARPPHDPAAARALLDRYGYRDRDGDGWRERPDGSPLVLTLSSAVSSSRDFDELWQRSLEAVGLRIAFNKQRGGDLLKAARLGKLQMYSSSMGPNPPEGIFYLDLLYGPFAGNLNHSRFALAEFDRLYERIREMPHGPARDRDLRKASELVAAHAPFVLHAWRVRTTLVRPWVRGYGAHPFHPDPWPLLDVVAAGTPNPAR